MASYRVVLQGIEPGNSPELALRNLAALSRTRVEALRSRLASGDLVVKHSVDRETAVRYQTAIRQTGWLCAVEQEMAPPAIPSAARTTTALPPAPVQTQVRPRRKLKTAAAFTAGTAAIVLGVGLYFNWHWPTIGPGVDIVGKWNCLPADNSKESRNYVVVFGSEGKFSMTSVISFETQFIGVYRRSNDQILVTLQGGAMLRKSTLTAANSELRGRVAGGPGDRLNFELPVPYLSYRKWSCSRL